MAAAYKARQEGKHDLRHVLFQSIQASKNATDIRNAYKMFLDDDKPIRMSNDDTLGLI